VALPAEVEEWGPNDSLKEEEGVRPQGFQRSSPAPGDGAREKAPNENLRVETGMWGRKQ